VEERIHAGVRYPPITLYKLERVLKYSVTSIRGWPMHVMGVQYWWSHHHYWTWAPPVLEAHYREWPPLDTGYCMELMSGQLRTCLVDSKFENKI